jgi:hypothetical protein
MELWTNLGVDEMWKISDVGLARNENALVCKKVKPSVKKRLLTMDSRQTARRYHFLSKSEMSNDKMSKFKTPTCKCRLALYLT